MAGCRPSVQSRLRVKQMHIMEGFLDPIWCAVWFSIAIPFVALGANRVIKIVRDHPEQKMTIALSGAFIFLLSSIKFPSVTGLSSHPTGTGFSAVLYGVSTTSFLSTIVLLFQAIVLAHGGITTLGAEIFSMGIAGPSIGVLLWNVLRKAKISIRVSIMLVALFVDIFTYVITSVQMTLNHGHSIDAFIAFMTNYAVTQIPLAIVESVLFFMFATYLTSNKPEIFDITNTLNLSDSDRTRSDKKI